MTTNKRPGLWATWSAISVIAAMLAAFGWPAAVSAQPSASSGTTVIGELMWLTRPSEELSWQPANEYCESLEHAGHRDWRLPTLAEVESLYDPSAAENGYIVQPIQLDGCCLWSSTSLAELSAEEGGERGGQGNPPAMYFWGFVFQGGVRYYSVQIFPDGQALCVRDVG